ncbi:MAG: hypothetical protein R3B96_08905 [Pirellulaceae bacterium]
MDGDSVSAAVEALFVDTRPEVDVQYDDVNSQLVVVGNREQLSLVEQTIAQFDPPDREFEIFDLRRNEPSSVSMAIRQLFEDLPFNDQPSVTTDSATGQLLVRATQEQMIEIRSLLERMGEQVLAQGTDGPGASSRRIRSIPSSARLREALDRVQEVWPAIRPNPIQVLGPAARDDDASVPATGSEGATTR